MMNKKGTIRIEFNINQYDANDIAKKLLIIYNLINNGATKGDLNNISWQYFSPIEMW